MEVKKCSVPQVVHSDGVLQWLLQFCGMAFLKIERKDTGTYLRIAESFRDQEGKTRHRILHSLGKVEDYSPQQLRSIGVRLYELGGGDIKALLEGAVQETGRFNYGYYQVYRKAFNYYGLDDVLRRIVRKNKISYDLENAVLLMLLERLQDPCSKRSNYIHQLDYAGLQPVYLQHLYRSLTRLADNSEFIQKQIFYTGRDLFSQQLDVVFYDVTTLYFESEDEFEVGKRQLRKKGFSKDGKIGNTQVLFCMLIDKDKNPIGYQLFKGNTFEGHTLPLAIEQLKKRYCIDKIIIVADRGMMGKENIETITQNGFEFIMGDRLKNLPHGLQPFLLDLKNYTREWIYHDEKGEAIMLLYCVTQHAGKTIIATYSAKRAAKDKHDREQKIKTAEVLLKRPSLIKKKASRYFITQQGENTYMLNMDKIEKDACYDGILVIATNVKDFTHEKILEQYKQLFKIEHTFRVFKSHLEARPMFHWTDKRIAGHICLCYIAYTLLNWVLQKLKDFPIPMTENVLRQMLNKMQVSLLEHKDKKIYLRSAQQPHEAKLQLKLGVRILPPILPLEQLTKYI